MNTEYQLTEQDLKEIEAVNEYSKRNMGCRGIEHCLTDDGFDRRKFGKMRCGCCGHSFNPYYTKTLKPGKWLWNWVGCDYRQPEAEHEVQCPKCKEQLRFTVYVPQ